MSWVWLTLLVALVVGVCALALWTKHLQSECTALRHRQNLLEDVLKTLIANETETLEPQQGDLEPEEEADAAGRDAFPVMGLGLPLGLTSILSNLVGSQFQRAGKRHISPSITRQQHPVSPTIVEEEGEPDDGGVKLEEEEDSEESGEEAGVSETFR